jgi:hypothetical protein
MGMGMWTSRVGSRTAQTPSSPPRTGMRAWLISTRYEKYYVPLLARARVRG